MDEALTPELYGEDVRAALAFAEAMTRRSKEIPEEVYAELERRWTPSEVVEIAAVVGLFNYFNLFNNALRVPPTEPSPYVPDSDAPSSAEVRASPAED